MFKVNACAFLILLLLPLTALAGEKIQIQKMSEAAAKIAQLEQRYAEPDILVVFDIDNTLLTSNQSLGGDAWFNWQAERISAGDTSVTVATDIGGLLGVQNQLFSIGKMHPPESVAPIFLNELQAKGIRVFLMTSRGSANVNATQRELARNGFAVGKTSPGPSNGFAGRILPFKEGEPESGCITAEEAVAWKLGRPRPIVYSEGIFFGEGQHKGAMLRALLCRTKGYAPKAIVFVDDTEKNIDRVLEAYDKSGIETLGLRYGQLDATVEAFKSSDKREVVDGWNVINAAINSVLK